MHAPSSTAVRDSGRTMRLVLVLLGSLATLFAATAVRPATLWAASPTSTLSAREHEDDAPVAIKEGRDQCRVSASRTPGDGKGRGVRTRDFALHTVRPTDAGASSPLLVDEGPSGPGSRERRPMRRIRRHLEVMVFLS